MSIARRLERIEAKLGDDDDIGDVVYVVHDGGPIGPLTKEEWLQYRREHPGDWLRIREHHIKED